MNFTMAIKSGFKNYFAFKGRASRSEFWYWQLFNYGLLLFCILLARIHVNAAILVSVVLTLGLLVPSFMIEIRRLHDIGRSGQWMWLRYSALYPVILIAGGFLILLSLQSDSYDLMTGLKNSLWGGVVGGIQGDLQIPNSNDDKNLLYFFIGLLTSNFWLAKGLVIALVVIMGWAGAVWYWFAFQFSKPSLDDTARQLKSAETKAVAVVNWPMVAPLVRAIVSAVWNLSDWQGKASRSLFWLWVLAVVSVELLASLIVTVFGLDLMTGSLMGLLVLATVTAAIRRLHDSGRTGHWMWLAASLYPLVLIYLVWFIKIVEDNWAVLVYKVNALGLTEGEPEKFQQALADLKDSFDQIDLTVFGNLFLATMLAYLIAVILLVVLLALPSKGAKKNKAG